MYHHITRRFKDHNFVVFCFYRLAAEIQQFTAGLGDLWNSVMQHLSVGKQLFIVSDNALMTFHSLRHLYGIMWSPAGSTRRREEETTVYQFESFLADCESQYQILIIILSSVF